MNAKELLKAIFVLTRAVWIACAFYFTSAYAQETPRFRNEAGTPINQDYFNLVGRPRGILQLVEEGHLNERVYRTFRAGQFQYVINDLNYLLERVVNHPRALQLLNSVAILSKQPSLPIPYYQKALSLYPERALTHAQYGDYLVEIGEMDNGIKELKNALELDPNLVAGHVWLAKAYYKSGDRELGDKVAEQAKKLGFKGTIPGGLRDHSP